MLKSTDLSIGQMDHYEREYPNRIVLGSIQLRREDVGSLVSSQSRVLFRSGIADAAIAHPSLGA